MNMLVSQIARFLDSKGLGEFDESGVKGDIFLLTQPPSPDECVSIYHRGGLEGDIELGYNAPMIQILVRGTRDPRKAYKRAEDIYKALHGYEGYFVPDGTYIAGCIGTQSGAIPIGVDKNDRHEFSINFRLETKDFTTNEE